MSEPMFLRVSRRETLLMVAVSVASHVGGGGMYSMAMIRLDSTSKLSSTSGAGVTHSTMVICAVVLLPLASQALLRPTLVAQLIWRGRKGVRVAEVNDSIHAHS